MTKIDYIWLGIGFLGQTLFAMRFIIQWLQSERQRRSVIPTAFWYFSLGGGVVLLSYALYKGDPVFIVGQFMGLFIYSRNLYLISVSQKAGEDGERASIPPRFTHLFVEKPELVGLIFGTALMVISAALFLIFPEWDIAVARLFFLQGVGFNQNHTAFIDFMRFLIPLMKYGVIAVVILGWLGKFIKGNTLCFSNKAALFLALSLALGPGLIVNEICKNGFHRARPHQIALFGGEKKFTSAFIITDQCEKNCSFVSGDPSIVFYLLAFVMLMRRRRFLSFLGVTVLGSIVGYGRICYGAHFLSDVIFSAFLTYLTILVCYVLVFRKSTKPELAP